MAKKKLEGSCTVSKIDAAHTVPRGLEERLVSSPEAAVEKSMGQRLASAALMHVGAYTQELGGTSGRT